MVRIKEAACRLFMTIKCFFLFVIYPDHPNILLFFSLRLPVSPALRFFAQVDAYAQKGVPEGLRPFYSSLMG
jgi:hypothetical protein